MQAATFGLAHIPRRLAQMAKHIFFGSSRCAKQLAELVPKTCNDLNV
jgi:hypothetical protein